MIIHYPAGVKTPGGVRNQFHYATDIAPTILEIVNVEPRSPYRGYDQMPIAGTSLAYTFGDADSQTRKPIQHFEMMGNRGLWHDGWKAVTRHETGVEYSDDDWELYHLDQDFSESNNLAAAEPDRLQRMIDMWWVEAGPSRACCRWTIGCLGSDRPSQRSLAYRFVPPMGRVPRAQSPAIGTRKWSLTADVEIQDASTEGVIYAQGSALNGSLVVSARCDALSRIQGAGERDAGAFHDDAAHGPLERGHGV